MSLFSLVPRRAAMAVLLVAILPAIGWTNVLFQADFNGSGGGTAEAANLVTFGGTGALTSGTNLTASIVTAPVLLSGAPGFLRLADAGTGSGAQGVQFVPASASHSPDAWFAAGPSFVSVNGALDFFVRSSEDSSAWGTSGSAFRPLDLNGGNGGLRLILNSFAPNRFQAELMAKNTAGATVIDLRACPASWPMEAGAVYHVAIVVATDPASGHVTLQLFIAPGNTAIRTASSAFLAAEVASSAPIPSTGSNAVTHAFNASSGFVFGQYGNPADTKTLDFGRLRVHDGGAFLLAAVAYLPDLPSPAKPSPEPAFPAGFETFSPPVAIGGAPAAGTPVAAEWIRNAGPGDGLIAAIAALTSRGGADAGKDTAFLCYGQSEAALGSAPAQIERTRGSSASVRLDAGLPTPAMYLVWPRNDNGYGAPMAVNRTEAWWVGPDAAAPGDTVSVFGRNLTFHLAGNTASDPSWIYLKPQGNASGQWITPTAANPYKADFQVPSGLASGTYEVWVHNGHGEHYGWSGPQLLSVNAGDVWNGPTYDVKGAYHATGNGVTDDTAAIRNALAAAATAPYSTVSFPAGTYLISSRLTLPAKVRLLGAGASTTTLLAASVDFSTGSRGFALLSLPAGTSHNAVSGLTFETGGSTNCWAFNGTASWLRVSDCAFLATHNGTQGPFYLSPCDHVFLQGSTFAGGGMGALCIIDGLQLFINGCHFYGLFDCALLNIKGHTSRMSCSGNTGEDWDHHLGYAYDPATSSYAGDPSGTGWAQGVFFKGLNGEGARHNLYFGDNTGMNLGVRLGNPTGNNWGEQLSSEYNWGQYAGTVVSATATGVTFNPATMTSFPASPGDLIAVVVNGTGQGQWRDVASVNPATGAVALVPGQAWNVVPDATSTVALGWYVENVVSYRNHFDGKPDRVGASGSWGITGFSPYGGVLGATVDSNLYTFNQFGIRSVAFVPIDATPQRVQPAYFYLSLNNTIQDCQYAIEDDLNTSWSGYQNTLAGPMAYAHVYRANTVSDTVPGSTLRGISMTSGPGNLAEGSISMILFEQNVVSDAPVGAELNTGHSLNLAQDLLLSGNAFHLGSAAASGSAGVDLPPAVPVGLRENTYDGFATVYAGTSAGAVLEAPLRLFEENAESLGAEETDTLMIRDAGTLPLNWNAVSDSTWLLASPTGGLVGGEGNEAGVTLSCNPLGLAPGDYTGNVTLTNGAQSQKVEVRFSVK